MLLYSGFQVGVQTTEDSRDFGSLSLNDFGRLKNGALIWKPRQPRNTRLDAFLNSFSFLVLTRLTFNYLF